MEAQQVDKNVEISIILEDVPVNPIQNHAQYYALEKLFKERCDIVAIRMKDTPEGTQCTIVTRKGNWDRAAIFFQLRDIFNIIGRFPEQIDKDA